MASIMSRCAGERVQGGEPSAPHQIPPWHARLAESHRQPALCRAREVDTANLIGAFDNPYFLGQLSLHCDAKVRTPASP